MIPRYEKKEISQLWTDEYKFSTYLEVELAILSALEGDKVPVGTADKIRTKAQINPARIEEIERTVKHDVIAFCTSITENLNPEFSRFFHYGVTSSDVIDTALSLQVKASLEVILPTFKKLCDVLLKRAQENKELICMGRSHGMSAEPMSFGQKLLGHYAEFSRRYYELKEFSQNEITGQFSGAVGNYTILSPEQERKALDKLGLKQEAVSTQVIPRDRLAKLISLNALTASAIERLAVEIRHLHRTEVDELHEGFKPGQKGSSIMPHKKNPIAGENLTGMARYLRSHAQIALENIVLWHERDISHSSTERLYLPDHFGILLYSLERLTSTVEQLELHIDKIQSRVEEQFSYLSSYYLHFLIDQSCLPREELYPLLQKAAFTGVEQSSRDAFFKTLKDEAKTKSINLEQLPTPNMQEMRKIYLKHVDDVFKRTLEQYPG